MRPAPPPSSEAALLVRIEALTAKVQSGLASISAIRKSRRTIRQVLAHVTLQPNQTTTSK
jgi:hypothetical protein